MTEVIQLIKAKFEQTDTVLKEIGLQLCELHKQNQLIKARLNKLEQVKDNGVELD